METAIKLQYYIGGIKSNKPQGLVDLETFIASHSNPKVSTIQLVDSIRLEGLKGDKKAKTALKEKLPFVVPPVIVSGRRQYSDIVAFTGVCQLDFDGVTEPFELKEYLFNKYEQFYCVYVSPSGGVKGLMRIPICKDVEEYQEYYQGIIDEFECIDGFDPAPKNAVLPLFVSYDYFLVSRKNPSTWTKKGKVGYSLKNDIALPPRPIDRTKVGEKNKRRALNTVRKMINQIASNGHPQLRTACLILGTRVGAGYLSFSEASEEVEFLVRTNNYLQKGIKGYLTTADWALKEGYHTPKYY